MLNGNEGIFGKTKKAIDEHNLAEAEEALKIKLADILVDKNGEKNLNYLNGMEISGYDVQISDVGRIVTMIKNDEVYYFLVDSEYNINKLNNINNIGGGNIGQGNINDYRENLLYQVDFNNLLNNPNEKITIKDPEGITIDSTNTYATFDGTGGIAIDGDLVDSEGRLLGTSSKTISLWYRTSNNNNIMLLQIGNELYGKSCFINIWSNRIDAACHNGYCDAFMTNLKNRLDGSWHHVVAVFDGGNKTTLYFDNVSVQGTGSYNTSNSILTIRNGSYEPKLFLYRRFSRT